VSETVLDRGRTSGGNATPEQSVARSFAHIRAHGDAAIFINLRKEAEALAEARALTAGGNVNSPLYGIPIAVKDTIDVAGLPTRAGCRACPSTSDPTTALRLRRRSYATG
jgi:allophanate hydrolase